MCYKNTKFQEKVGAVYDSVMILVISAVKSCKPSQWISTLLPLER